MHSAVDQGSHQMDETEIKENFEQRDHSDDLETATNVVLERIADEPAYENVLYKILKYCETTHTETDLEQAILSFPEMKNSMHSPQILLSWLEDAGGIERIVQEQDEPIWRITPAGQNAANILSEDNRLRKLFAEESRYHDIFVQVLEGCSSPKSRMDIEDMLEGNPILEKPKVYPSFFIEMLEKAGGLVWDEKWKTTQAGKDFLKSLNQ